MRYTLVAALKNEMGCVDLEEYEVDTIEEAVDKLMMRGVYPCACLLFEGKTVSDRWNESGSDPLHLEFIRRMEAERKDSDYREYLRLKKIYEPDGSWKMLDVDST